MLNELPVHLQNIPPASMHLAFYIFLVLPRYICFQYDHVHVRGTETAMRKEIDDDIFSILTTAVRVAVSL